MGERALQSLSRVVSNHLDAYFAAHEGMLPSQGLYDRVVREVEIPLILKTLKAAHGIQAKAAKILGMHRNTLRIKMQDLDLTFKKQKL